MALREEAHESPVDTYLTLDDRRVNSQRTRPLPLQEENAHLRVQEVDTVLIVDGTGVEEQRNESGGKRCYRWSQGCPRGVFSPQGHVTTNEGWIDATKLADAVGVDVYATRGNFTTLVDDPSFTR
jgi:hypothetical protein